MTQSVGEILSGEKPVQEAETHTDEPKTETEAKEPEKAVSDAPADEPADEEVPPSGMVPHKALHASRERARQQTERANQLERDLAEERGRRTALEQMRQQPPPAPLPPKEPPKPVEMWDDPRAFVRQELTPLERQVRQQTFNVSRRLAIAEHGKEAVDAAETALREAVQSGKVNPEQLAASIQQSLDPIGDVVNWHKNQPANREAELRAQIEAEFKAKYGIDQPDPQGDDPPAPTTPKVMPSPLVAARNVGNRSGPAWSGPAPLKDIFARGQKKKAG